MGSRLAALGCAFVLLLSAGCGGMESNTPGSVARSYEQAIVSKDGKGLCATFAPKLREVLAEHVTDEQAAAGATERPRFACGSFFDVVLNGFPHENVDREFVAAKLLGLGSQRRVGRGGRVYARVAAKLRIQFVYTGYSIHGGTRGKKGAAVVEDVMWLTKGTRGRWGVVKPSLALQAAGSPDVLYERWQVERANAAPPDPDYSMTRAERTAWEAADYRASFRRTIGHGPVRCAGRTVSVADPVHDGVTYPSGSALHPEPAPRANDITRVAVQAAGRRICVTVTFRRKPAEHTEVGFTPRSRHVFFPEYLVEIVPSRGARGGGLTGGYRYFRGGEKLSRGAVREISLYGRTIAFVANAAVVERPVSDVPPDLGWSVIASAPTGSDHVPNHAPGQYILIRQRDGRRFKP